MKLTIEINLDNAAFDGDDGAQEVKFVVSRFVNKAGNNVRIPGALFQLYDTNGNRCGTARVTRTRPNKRSKNK